jgi:hypothetical protein
MTPFLLAVHPLATTNAVLNAISTVLLVIGLVTSFLVLRVQQVWLGPSA